MTPEAQARQRIDRQLQQCGWLVQDHARIHISAGRGVAVREFPLATGSADYLLYVDGKAAGVVEAKPEGHSLVGVETQSGKYRDGLPAIVPRFQLPLPFAYESTGVVTRFTDAREPDARGREVFAFHRPEELRDLIDRGRPVRARLREMPELNRKGLWDVQAEAVANLERSLADNRPRALVQMATGSGKTYTAVSACYRLIKFGNARRVLFLVDRNNLGRQSLCEFQQYVNPYTNRAFTEEYPVQHLRAGGIDPAAKVCICTIQRLYAMLRGEELREESEDGSLFEAEAALPREPLPVAYNPALPIGEFDFVVIDECHRSIYNLWRQVLDYFDAFLIGLTATPTAQTVGFFGGNLVQEYTHERAVADGVNVGYDVFRIETRVTRDGATLAREPGVYVPRRDRRTRAVRYQELDDDLTYTANQLDRDVVALGQIRLVLSTFRDHLPAIFPGRREVPKTLIFAKTDAHAEDIVRIAREEFGGGNDFCQKITAKSHRPDELLQQFRNAYHPRIAVTVDMIATGTDVKPLECLLFLRNIRSLSYFEQMKGRGCRIVDPDTLQGVTPDARAKTHFVIVDAVGVCEGEKAATRPLDRQPSVPLETILKAVAAGAADADTASTLAARLTRLDRQIDPVQRRAIADAAGGRSLPELAACLLRGLDPDAAARLAVQSLPPDAVPTEDQIQAAEYELLSAALRPFHDPDLRQAITDTRAALDQVIDEQTRDSLIRAEFDGAALDAARSLVTTFREFIDAHKDEIEALRVLYGRPYRAGLRYAQVKELAAAFRRPPHNLQPERVWQAFEAVEPNKVRGHGGKQLVDIIALVRHALDPDTILAPVGTTVAERYQTWLADQERAGATFTDDQRRWLDAIRDHIATSLAIDRDDLDDVPFNRIGGLGRASELFGDRLAAILDDLNARLAA